MKSSAVINSVIERDFFAVLVAGFKILSATPAVKAVIKRDIFSGKIGWLLRFRPFYMDLQKLSTKRAISMFLSIPINTKP